MLRKKTKFNQSLPNKRSWAVHLMLSVEDEKNIECLCKSWIGLVFILIESVHHVEEIIDIRKISGRIVVAPANARAIRICSNCWNLSEDTEDLLVSDLEIAVDILSSESRVGTRTEGRKCCNSADKHAHRMCVISEAVHHILDIRVKECVSLNPMKCKYKKENKVKIQKRSFHLKITQT